MNSIVINHTWQTCVHSSCGIKEHGEGSRTRAPLFKEHAYSPCDDLLHAQPILTRPAELILHVEPVATLSRCMNVAVAVVARRR